MLTGPAGAGRLEPLSVVIPSYNRGQLLGETLELCRRFSKSLEIEFVVIDDGSSDDTAERLDRLSKQMPELVWRSVPNAGPGAARNLGASLARHDVVLFIGDDIRPVDANFFRVHAELHGRHADPDLAVLGKLVWPNRTDARVNFVMSHVQGRGGEQFGFADLRPYSYLDWRFFYTSNISLRKSIVSDWLQDGFSSAFGAAAYEDVEFAYRLSQRERPLRIFYTPASVGSHHHHFSVSDFMNRQQSAGMMARVFYGIHPNREVRDMIGLAEIVEALRSRRSSEQDRSISDLLAVIEGLKSWTRLIEDQMMLGSQHWHDDLLTAVFELCYLEAYVSASSDPDENLAGAYRYILDRFSSRMTRVIHIELSDLMLSPTNLFSLGHGASPAGGPSRLRIWAAQKRVFRTPYLAIRRFLLGR